MHDQRQQGRLPVSIQVGTLPAVTVGEIAAPGLLPELLTAVARELRAMGGGPGPDGDPGSVLEGAVASDLASSPLATRLRRRSPYDRSRWFADKRAELGRDGRPAGVLDVAEQALAAEDRRSVDVLRQRVGWVVDSFAVDHHLALSRLPSSWATRLVVEMTIACLYAHGLASTDGGSGLVRHPLEWRAAVPPHLHPDVSGAEAFFATMDVTCSGDSDHDQGGDQ